MSGDAESQTWDMDEMSLEDVVLSNISDDDEAPKEPEEQPESTDEEEEAPKESSDDEDDEKPEESDEEGEESDEEEEEDTPGPDDPVELSDDKKVKVGDEVLTGKELREGRLRQADYTRKTQQLAEQRKEFEADQQAIKQWFQSLKDPQELRSQIADMFPEAFDEAVIARAKELYQEYQLPDEQRKAQQEARKIRQENERLKREREEWEKARQEQTKKETLEQARQFYARTVPKVLQENGLEKQGDDAHNRQMVSYLVEELKDLFGEPETHWSERQIKVAAKSLLDRDEVKKVAGYGKKKSSNPGSKSNSVEEARKGEKRPKPTGKSRRGKQPRVKRSTANLGERMDKIREEMGI